MASAARGVLTLAETAAAAGGELLQGDGGRPITAVVTDSRAAGPGALFAALRGPRADGHAFVGAAAARGAAAALVTRAVDTALPLVRVPDVLAALLPLSGAWRARFPARAIGVTGSTGKTTTVRMLAGMLGGEPGARASYPSWNAEIGVPLTLFGLRAHHRFVVVEMGMRGAGHIAELCAAARPEIGVITNVGESHLEALGTIDDVARAKGELVAALPPGGTAVLNADDPRVVALRPPPSVSVLRFGFAPDADVRAEAVLADASGSRFRLASPRGSVSVRLAVPGRHLVMNALAAAAAAVAAAADLAAIAEALERFVPPPMRLDVRTLEGDVLLVDDTYNASPASLRAAFDTVASLRGGRRVIVVLGEMLELGAMRDPAHAEAGALAAGHAVARLITVGDGGRLIADAAQRAGVPASAVDRASDPDDAGARLRACVRPGDVVLVKASRGVGLERAVAMLLSHRPAASDARAGDPEGA